MLLVLCISVMGWCQIGSQIACFTAFHNAFFNSLHMFSIRCEQLLGVNRKLRQELMLLVEPIPELQERLGQLLQVLIQR